MSMPVDPHKPINRRIVLSGLGGAAGVVAFPSLFVPSACAQVSSGPALRSSAFPSFRAAAERWASTGGTLLVDRDHVEREPITVACVPGLTYRLSSEGARTVTYAGPHYHWLLCLLSQGRNPFVVDGDLTFDGGNRCSMPFFARFETVGGSARRDFLVDGLTVRNARMRHGRTRDGAPANAYGATGMAFAGGFDHLHLRNVRALEISREAGAGHTGSQGCIGIAVGGNINGTESARHVLIEDFEVVNVNADDGPGSPARSDMDGVLVFQAAERSGTRPVIRRGVIREAAGRAVKVFAPGGGGVTRDLQIYRSVPGVTGGSNDVAHQHGDGLIDNIQFHYSGRAHSQPTIPIGMSSGTARAPGFPFGEGIIRNITINDSTGQPKRAIAILFYNVGGDSSARRYVLTNIRDSGSAHHLFLPGALGVTGAATIEIEEVDVNLTTGVMATEDRTTRLRVQAHGLTNRNPRGVPFRVMYNGRAAPPGLGGQWITDATVRGVMP